MHLLPFVALAFIPLVFASSNFSSVSSVSVFAPGKAFDGEKLDAAKKSFLTGLLRPSTYCTVPPKFCPPVVGTLVRGWMAAMAVVVPGGQQIYVQPDGQVKYLGAHSGFIPKDGIFSCWVGMMNDTTGTILNFDDGNGHKGVTLCPDIPGTGSSFKLYGKTAGFNVTGCTDITGVKLTPSNYTAGGFQYE
ncbi:hypothetical protein GGR50DRAFT_223191 [Xylaria sp. CBS 124048]|nr:hypothetical protein GGR50DRAFT_223191 [Xylaria sp. CBS 124048]